ncbi:MAG: cbb3-type cytochrome oxidase assembly protein [Gammaproteobacteria bacterium]
MYPLTSLIFWQFLVAVLMGAAALCLFAWAVITGQFSDIEKAKYDAYHAEVSEEDDHDQRT